jgi:hypothetical protein
MSFTKQSERVCDECGRRFLSGVAHLDRGVVASVVCWTCAEKDGTANWGWLKHLTKHKREAAAKARKAKSNA